MFKKYSLLVHCALRPVIASASLVKLDDDDESLVSKNASGSWFFITYS